MIRFSILLNCHCYQCYNFNSGQFVYLCSLENVNHVLKAHWSGSRVQCFPNGIQSYKRRPFFCMIIIHFVGLYTHGNDYNFHSGQFVYLCSLENVNHVLKAHWSGSRVQCFPNGIQSYKRRPFFCMIIIHFVGLYTHGNDYNFHSGQFVYLCSLENLNLVLKAHGSGSRVQCFPNDIQSYKRRPFFCMIIIHFVGLHTHGNMNL